MGRLFKILYSKCLIAIMQVGLIFLNEALNQFHSIYIHLVNLWASYTV